MDRTPGIPVIVTRKTDEETVNALKKRNKSDREIEIKIKSNKRHLEDAINKYPDRIHIANTSNWFEDPDDVMGEVYNFLGLEWHSEYLNMEAFNAKRPPGSVLSKAFEKV